jgi:Outer membrane protein beta-barrel domain
MRLIVRHMRTAVGVMFVLACSAGASAQDAGYVAGAAFADIRQFGGASSQTPLFGGDVSQDATGAGGSLRIGTWVHPRWTLEVGADVTSRTSQTVTGPVIAIFPPVPPLELTTSTRFLSVSTLVGFHSPSGRRVRLGYLAGFSFMRTRHTTEVSGIGLPAFVFEQLGLPYSTLSMGSIASPSRASSLTLPASALKSTRNSGALTLGFEAAINITQKLAVVPELRASTFSTSPGGGVFLIRPGVGVRWGF